MPGVVDAVLAALAAGDRSGLRLLLHPHLHWTTPEGTVVRGRTRVLALLETSPLPPRPASVELRDGQVYRWTC
ncbi:hypothetical protein [Blastococcus sp. SYSU D00695]